MRKTDSWLTQPLVVIDTETTSADPTTCRPVEVAVVRVAHLNDPNHEPHVSLVKSDVPIGAGASAVNGIFDEDLVKAPTLSKLMPYIEASMKGAIPVAYNASFDATLLRLAWGREAPERPLPAQLWKKHHWLWIDPLVLARHFHRHEKSRKLGDVAAKLGITNEKSHRADGDALTTLRILRRFVEMFPEEIPTQIGEFFDWQDMLRKAGGR